MSKCRTNQGQRKRAGTGRLREGGRVAESESKIKGAGHGACKRMSAQGFLRHAADWPRVRNAKSIAPKATYRVLVVPECAHVRLRAP
jgi:hypothetical protein